MNIQIDRDSESIRSDLRSRWELVGSVPEHVFADARIQLHWAAQLVAAPGHSFAPPEDDYSHTALRWDTERRLLVGQPIAAPKGFTVGLGIVDLSLVVFDEHDRKVSEIALDRMSLSDAKNWLEDILRNRLGRDSQFELSLPDYEMPQHPVGRGGRFSFRPAEAFDELDKLYGNAAVFLHTFASARASAGPVLTWPHHFDTATLINVDDMGAGSSAQRTIGVGFSPGKGDSSVPYWYVNMWPHPPTGELPDTIAPGRWHTDKWVGAELPLATVSRERTRAAQLRVLDRFVSAAADAVESLHAIAEAQ